VVSREEAVFPGTSAVIPTWNRAADLERCLDSLGGFAEVIVVDNGSTDGAGERARARGAQVVRFEENRGFAAAVNAGIAAAAGEWVAVLNNDVVLQPGWLGALLGAASEETWFLCGRVLQAAHPERIDGTWDAVPRSGCPWRVGYGMPATSFTERRAIHAAPMTAALFRRALFARVGLLEERFESYLEDVDFGLRCAKAGCGGLFVPEAQALHAGSATLGAWSPPVVRLLARNQRLLVARHWPAGQYRREVWVGQWLWGLLALRHGVFDAWMAGRREGAGVPARGDEAIAAVLEEGERAIQDAPGAYWRWYRRLTR
jgi:hypothetical protein